MGGDGVSAADGDALDRRFERVILERLHLAAVVADQVVVVLASGFRALEPRDAVAEVHPLCEPELVEPLQRAVDAGDPEPAPGGPDSVVDLLRRETAVLVAEELDDEPARATAAAPRLAKSRESAFAPLCPTKIMIPVLKDVLRSGDVEPSAGARRRRSRRLRRRRRMKPRQRRSSPRSIRSPGRRSASRWRTRMS